MTTHHWHLGRAFWSWSCKKFRRIKEAERAQLVIIISSHLYFINLNKQACIFFNNPDVNFSLGDASPYMIPCAHAQSCPTLLQLRGLYPARHLCPWDFPGKNPGVGSHFLLQGIFPTQQSNPRFLHWQVDSLPTAPAGKPIQWYSWAFTFILQKLFETLQWSRQASLVGRMVKNLPAMQETWVWSLGWEDPLEKEVATHFSILARRIPGTGESGGLQPMGSQGVRHNWATKTQTLTHSGPGIDQGDRNTGIKKDTHSALCTPFLQGLPRFNFPLLILVCLTKHFVWNDTLIL